MQEIVFNAVCPSRYIINMSTILGIFHQMVYRGIPYHTSSSCFSVLFFLCLQLYRICLQLNRISNFIRRRRIHDNHIKRRHRILDFAPQPNRDARHNLHRMVQPHDARLRRRFRVHDKKVAPRARVQLKDFAVNLDRTGHAAAVASLGGCPRQHADRSHDGGFQVHGHASQIDAGLQHVWRCVDNDSHRSWLAADENRRLREEDLDFDRGRVFRAIWGTWAVGVLLVHDCVSLARISSARLFIHCHGQDARRSGQRRDSRGAAKGNLNRHALDFCHWAENAAAHGDDDAVRHLDAHFGLGNVHWRRELALLGSGAVAVGLGGELKVEGGGVYGLARGCVFVPL